MSLTVIISGASSGLGRVLALHYARQGAILGLIARRRELLQELAQELPGAAVYVADVRDAVAMQAVAQDFMRHHGCPDIVIANAGISRGTLTEYVEDSEVFADILATNVNGMLFFTATDGASGVELWKSDGTVANTVVQADDYRMTHGVVTEVALPADVALGFTRATAKIQVVPAEASGPVSK